MDLEKLAGKLIVVEGADGSGRSTQIAKLVDWLEASGHATVQVGLKRSTLVSEELEKAQEGNILSHTTLSLFYATDFADQLDNIILPALRAGFMVLADRYIYTLMVRDLVRGLDENWLKNLYGMALIPDAVFYLNVSPEELVQRNFAKNAGLDYWEEVNLRKWPSLEALQAANASARFFYATTKSSRPYFEAKFEPGDFFVFGRETKGLQETLLERNSESCLTIPMEGTRSLNLATAVAIILFEAMRQQRC